VQRGEDAITHVQSCPHVRASVILLTPVAVLRMEGREQRTNSEMHRLACIDEPPLEHDHFSSLERTSSRFLTDLQPHTVTLRLTRDRAALTGMLGSGTAAGS
jgi:hypothetical protein